MNELLKNQIYESAIDNFSSDGSGICHINGRAVFVPKTIPGEKWRIRIVKANKTAVFGRAESLIEPSIFRCQPLCPAFGKCGGCSTMHLTYDKELEFKLEKVNSALKHIGKQTIQADTILASDEIESYRNKSIYNYSQTTDGPVCGFYRSRSHDIIYSPRCFLQPMEFDLCASALLKWLIDNNIPAYNEKEKSGTVRHLFLRKTGTGFIACVISAKNIPLTFKDSLLSSCPSLTGILLCINSDVTNVALNHNIRTIWGSPTIMASILNTKIQLSPATFFQINSSQAEKLYSVVRDYAKPEGKTILDLYCGAGSIGLSIAKASSQIIGNDITPSAVENAVCNALMNDFNNTEYICGDATIVAKDLLSRKIKPDVIIVDPPRKGLTPEGINCITEMIPDDIIYVSCNPATLARDLYLFNNNNYYVKACTAVDMFPRTSHVESVVLLCKK